MNRPRRFNAEQVEQIRLLYRTTEINLAQLARRFKCSSTLIAQVVDGKYRPRTSPDETVPMTMEQLRDVLAQNGPFHFDRETYKTVQRFVIRDKINRQICTITPHVHDSERFASAVLELLNGDSRLKNHTTHFMEDPPDANA